MSFLQNKCGLPSRNLRSAKQGGVGPEAPITPADYRIFEHLVEAWTPIAALSTADTCVAVMLDHNAGRLPHLLTQSACPGSMKKIAHSAIGRG